MKKVAICICTRRRPDGLKKLLDSFMNMSVPDGTLVRIIIVENDHENRSEKIVKEHSLKSKLIIEYYLESKPGLVIARNRSVSEAGECDFCCFTDDDEVVEKNWLKELLRCQDEFNADGVAGPTMPLFGKKVPAYIKKFHEPDTHRYGAIVGSAFTGCLLLRKSFLDSIDGPFNVRLNFSGGEDSFLTKQISSLGGIIRFNPDAVAHEIIPDNRTTVRFVLKRTFRTSNTELAVKSMNDRNFRKSGAFSRLVLRFCYGILILIPVFIFGKHQRLKGLIKITNAIGGFAFIFGKKSQFYK